MRVGCRGFCAPCLQAVSGATPPCGFAGPTGTAGAGGDFRHLCMCLGTKSSEDYCLVFFLGGVVLGYNFLSSYFQHFSGGFGHVGFPFLPTA